MRDEAPRFMGEGFVVAASNEIDVYYYMDEAGVIPPNDQVRFNKPLSFKHNNLKGRSNLKTNDVFFGPEF